MSDIFISHVEEDASIAMAVGRELETSGYTTWLYERDSLPGPAYLLQTGEAISQSQAFVLIISPDSVVSNQVTAEVVRAHESNVPFLPLLHGISHLEFQESQPVWRQALGAATSIEIFQENIQDAVRRIVGGLKAMGVEGGVSTQPAGSSQPITHVPSTSGFVGRQVEMGELTGALDDAFAGRGRMVMLVGEPGIGKTRCAQELATIAQVRGAQVVWGQCHESEGAPPYWIWTQAIRSYIQDKDEAQLLSVMGVGASDIAEVVPEVKLRMPDLESSPQLESPEQARFRLFDSVTTFLKNASRSQPLIIILDDLQWADRSSLMLLEFMVREMRTSRLLVVGTYRDVDISRDHQLSQVLGVLTREQLFTRVNFSGLSQEEVGDYVKTASSISPIPGLAEAVFGRTNGNPLFVSEVVQLLEQEGIEDNQSWATAIPEGVRDAIGRRLNRLSKECNRVLTTASVIGREFSLDLLDMLIDWADEDQLLDLLEQALSTHVIEEIPRTLGRYQFSHALIQDTLSDEMSATRRIRLHARIAEGLEGLYGSDAPAHAGEIAYHFAQAEQVLGGEKLLLYSTIAGERDLDSYAYESALAHFQRALGAREDQPMDDQLAAIMLGIGLSVGRSMASVDEAQQAWDALSQAFDYYVEQGDIEKALHVAFQPIPVMMYVSGAADLSARALELVPSESLQAGYLLSRRAGSLAYDSNDSDGSRSAAIKAIAIARRENDEILEARSLAFLVTPLLIDHRAQEAIEAGLRAAEIAKRTGDFESEMLANFYSSQILFVIGEPDRSRSHADAAYKVAVKLHDRENQFFCLVNMAVCAAYEGKWANANQLADQGLEIIGLAFEYSGNVERDREMVRRFAQRHGIQYTLLLAGTSDKTEAAAALGFLDQVIAYPTTIFLDRQHRVQGIHSGFAGPGTGEHYTELVAELTRRIEDLL
ncbi:MAG: AAA family ATPase [Chloroflexi bacterium]|nr:AAA family ATPase [Chloroflexota bacterium]